MPAKRKLVTNLQLNEFIEKHAPESNNWQDLREKILKDLNVKLSRKAVANRGNNLGVKTKNLAPQLVQVLRTYDVNLDASLTAKQVLEYLRRKKSIHTVESLANALVTSPQKIREAITELKAGGHTVDIDEGIVELSSQLLNKSEPVKIDKKLLDGNKFKFLLTADNHLVNKHERLDVLNALFDIAEGEGVTTCYQLGNMIDGDHYFNKHEVKCVGLDKQSEYLVDNWPNRKNITTHFITGDDHEGWYINRDNIDVGFYLQQKFEKAGRTDFQYVGHVEADVLLPGKKQRSVLRLIHAGGGTAYATSYTTQKIVESYQGGEKPRILAVGHYHKANFDYAREVFTFQAGCTCDQTTFMRKKRIPAHVGGWIIEATINNDGDVIRCKGDWVPFYDKGTYNRAWRSRGIR